MSATKPNVIVLDIMPTVFPDLNKKLGYEADHETTKVTVQRMKHKHIRQMQTMSESKQMHFIMTELTGLSANDIDELDAEDSAALSEVIFGFMKKFAAIAKQMMDSDA